MNTHRHSWAFEARSGIAAGFVVCLAGCSVQSPPVIRTSAGIAPPSITQVHIVEPDGEQTQRGLFYSAITRELQRRGVERSDSAPFVADLAFSVSSSSIGVFASEAGETSAEPEQLATTREPRWYDSCQAARVEASLVLYNRTDGTLQKSGEAEGIICEDGELPFDGIARLLADDLLSD